MKKMLSLFAATVLIAGVAGYAVQSQAESIVKKFKGETIAAADMDEYGGADIAGGAGDNASSRYYVNPDFYRMKSDDQLTILTGFKTMQQTTEWSCGNATALMVLHHFGKTDATEQSIAEAMKSHTDKDVSGAPIGSANNVGEYGTNVEQMVQYFASRDDMRVVESSYKANIKPEELIADDANVAEHSKGNLPGKFSAMSLYTSENSDESEAWVEDAKDTYFVKWLTGHLNAGRPVMVEWADWNGHWQAIIGYDNNGTPTIADDVLIFADPYDTTDHWQDGYYYYPLERWFYMWTDHNVAPKPFQIQPYLVVDKVA